MSVSSLNKFTVPTSNDAFNPAQGLLMPKLRYRWRVTLLNFAGVYGDVTELTKQVVSVARPTASFEDIVVDTYNSKIKLAGKPSWNDINLVLRDDATNWVSRLVGRQIQYQFDFMEQSSARAGQDYKFITRIEMLDGGNGRNTPTVLETWELYGAYIQSAAYGELSYAENNPVEITLTLKYDNAIQTAGLGLGESNGVGTFVGRTPAGFNVEGGQSTGVATPGVAGLIAGILL